jgi:hypothetical protein
MVPVPRIHGHDPHQSFPIMTPGKWPYNFKNGGGRGGGPFPTSRVYISATAVQPQMVTPEEVRRKEKVTNCQFLVFLEDVIWDILYIYIS